MNAFYYKHRVDANYKAKRRPVYFFSDPRTFSCAALALPEQFSEETLDWSG